MTRSEFNISKDPQAFLAKALVFADRFSHFSLFQNNGIPYPHKPFRPLLAIGARGLITESQDCFGQLAKFHRGEWLFGYLGYDLKNELEALESRHSNHTHFDKMCFFKPEILIEFHGGMVTVEADDPESVVQTIESLHTPHPGLIDVGDINSKISKTEYLATVEQLRRHIAEGDIYEINFCQEFYGKIDYIDPVEAYLLLNQKSPAPFSAFQKFDDQYLLCASPERFLKKEGNRLISQPIKGTIKRGKSAEEDQQLQHQLRHDEKELAENMMIVDLVRNDLAKSSKPGTVEVEEFFGIYPFEQVHQMISTITSQLKPGQHFTEILRHTFPMGSMTGTPKIKVMELIEQYEHSRRGLFSGAAGYITPGGDFDFNVVIRSLFLNMRDQQYSFQVGSAITYDSDPEKEYEECLLKISAISQVLQKVSAPEVVG